MSLFIPPIKLDDGRHFFLIWPFGNGIGLEFLFFLLFLGQGEGGIRDKTWVRRVVAFAWTRSASRGPGTRRSCFLLGGFDSFYILDDTSDFFHVHTLAAGRDWGGYIWLLYISGYITFAV